MDGPSIVVLVVLVLLALLAAGAYVMRRKAQKRAELQDRFGPEYERAVDEQGGAKQAEKRLTEVAERRDDLEVRELQPAERHAYAQQWTTVQASFVDHPAAAARDADRLVGSVMRDRGYPVDDFETKAEMVSVDHPDVVEHYRAAHAVGSRSVAANTEELRQAFVHYRALFETLLGDEQSVDLRSRERTERKPPA
jgi:uncharacterized protein YneF (UPF0154 family)